MAMIERGVRIQCAKCLKHYPVRFRSTSNKAFIRECLRIQKSNYCAECTLPEARRYVPLVLHPKYIVHNNYSVICEAALHHFGVLSSAMHMAWMKEIFGRLDARYFYKPNLVYNSFPWPQTPTTKRRAAVEEATQALLDVRKKFPAATLGHRYDPIAMPRTLVKAHALLDRAVDLCYRRQSFENECERIEYLFTLYERRPVPLVPLLIKGRQRARLN
jgi:hypothetical protein